MNGAQHRKQNLHTHSVYSDGNDTFDEMLESAIGFGFDTIGFSDHSYTKFDESYCMLPDREPAYRKETEKKKKEYEGKIEIFSGIELDADSEYPDYDYDYIIGSTHYWFNKDGKWYALDHTKEIQRQLADENFHGSFTDMAKAYFEHMTESIIKRKPDIVGHFDVITKFSLIDESDEEYRKAAGEAVHEITKHVKRFEINTGAIARKLRDVPYPSEFITSEIIRCGGEFCISSDCHYRERLNTWYDEGIEYIKQHGAKTIATLTKDGWISEKI